MKKIYYLIPLILLLFSCSDYKSNDYKELNLKGKVKTQRSFLYDATEKFGEIEKSRATDADIFDHLDLLTSNVIYEFSTNGGLETFANFYKNGEIFQKFISDGLNIKQYDGYGDLILVFKSNDLVKPTEINAYRTDGSLYLKIKNSYNKNDELIEEVTYDSDGDLEETSIYEYENGLISKRKNTARSNSWRDNSFIETTEEYKYNNNNDMVERIISTKSKTSTHTFQYEYDNKNNWIKRTEFKDDRPKYIIDREITYYWFIHLNN